MRLIRLRASFNFVVNEFGSLNLYGKALVDAFKYNNSLIYN